MKILTQVALMGVSSLALAGGPPDGEPAATKSTMVRPTQLMFSADGARLFVHDAGAGGWAAVEVASGQIAPFSSGGEPEWVVAAAADGRASAAVDRWNARLLVQACNVRADPKSFAPEAARSIEIDPRPQALAFVPDSNNVIVACDTPGTMGRTLCLVDLSSGKVDRVAIRAASNLRGVAVDPRGQFALATHLVPKFRLPSTQIDQGWVFVNALSFVELAVPRRVVTLPLDLRTQGFANPEGVAIADGGQIAMVAHAGADVVSIIDLGQLRQVVGEALAARASQPSDDQAAILLEDFRLTRRYVRARVAVGANPCAVAAAPDSTLFAVANRLAGTVSLVDGSTGRLLREIRGAPTPARDSLNMLGERLFFSGRLAFSGQFSCASCHPDGHTDGLNWDLPADGFNNFHNTKTLLEIDGTAPYGWLGTSPDLSSRFSGTLRHLFQYEPPPLEVEAIDAYLKRLVFPRWLGSPATHAQRAQAGRRLFETTAGCTECHAGSKLTDRAVHDVGTGGDSGVEGFDTPSLRRLAHTAPYLHDGRAATLEELFLKHNSLGMHGRASALSAEELRDLIEYLKTL